MSFNMMDVTRLATISLLVTVKFRPHMCWKNDIFSVSVLSALRKSLFFIVRPSSFTLCNFFNVIFWGLRYGWKRSLNAQVSKHRANCPNLRLLLLGSVTKRHCDTKIA
ncbi:hypothetical protein VNO77_17520 [Canavalia gladiata]|uniref:Uncharacterized protein n=1 Tax=Canavalia gladiata TaxID=3824 RepID=A0AAN9QJF8_CANGL